MQKQEFEERIERTVTDEQYKVIEEVYMWHPSIRNTSGKDEVAELYKSFGMTIFHDMLPRAKKAHELDELLRNAQREVQRIQEEMQITGANDVDIMLDEDGQPVSDGNGDTALVSDDECWLQDIKNEAMTEEGELFYEDEEGDASYGWSLLDFMQGEYDDFTQMEIQQRIRSKMSKRDYIDAGSIQTTVNFDGHIYHIRIAFRRTDSNSEYNIDIESNGVEVIVE